MLLAIRPRLGHGGGHQFIHVPHVVVVAEFAFQTVEQVVRVHQRVVDVHRFV